MIRAIVFDLDDTLYAEREYAFSGFAAVAREFTGLLGDPEVAASQMRRLFDTADRPRVFNALVAERGFTVDPDLIRNMVQTYRAHRPAIWLLPDADAALRRYSGRYRLGLITDGPARQQWAKIEALNLRPRLDEIIVTSELRESHETTKPRSHDGGGVRQARSREEVRSELGGCSKPHPRAFELIAQRLAVKAGECVYVADNPEKDFVAPNRLGWLTIRVKRKDAVYENCTAAAGGEASRVITTLDALDECLGLLTTGPS